MKSDTLPQGTCCIVGGGPAGMMLGYLLARAGIEVLVLEKHADFLRDFRGDTVHPSTLEVIHELGLLDEFLKRPHQKQVRQFRARIGSDEIVLGDMSYISTQCRFMVMMPQWEFLDFLAGQARCFPSFHLRMETPITELIEENGRIVGIRGSTPAGPMEVRTDLVVAADGRNSVARACSGLAVEDLGAPMDVLWMRLSRRAADPGFVLYADRGKTLNLIDRGDYWQCGLPAPKGAFKEMQAKGVEALRADIVELAPFFGDRVMELRDWGDVKVLTVSVNRMPRWHRPGLVCIGDAAHAMSPVGGVGINLAIQDAVAAANILAGPLRRGTISVQDLAKIQRRRAFPTRLTQRVQGLIQRNTTRGLLHPETTRLPWILRVLERTKLPCRIRTRVIAVGVRQEHVKTPDHRTTDARADHLFFSAAAILSAGTIVAGFSRSYYLKAFTGARPLPFVIHAHALIFTAWLVLFVTQTALVARGRVDLHRRLGIAGVALVALMLMVGVATAVLAARSGYLGAPGQESQNPQTFLIVPLRDITVFSIFAAVGLYFRRNAQLHKRLMLLAVIAGLMPAGVSRLPGISRHPPAIAVILLLFLMACPIYDLVRYRRAFPVYLCGAVLAFLLLPPVLLPFAMASQTWVTFANWLVR